MLWRVVITDAGFLEGIAPVCPRQMEPGGPHYHETVTGRFPSRRVAVDVWFDGQGVYECCPPPQLRAPDHYAAVQLADFMSACGIETR